MANILGPETGGLWSARKACIQGSSVALLIGAVTGIIAFMGPRGTPLLLGVSSTSLVVGCYPIEEPARIA